MFNPVQSDHDNALIRLMRDYGYSVRGNTIVVNRCGWMQERIMCRCRSVFDAAETLCPIIGDAAYTARLVTICRPTDDRDTDLITFPVPRLSE